MEDREVIRRVLEGDTGEFEKLMKKYGNSIYSLALKMTANRNDADDVYQEAWRRAFKYLDSYNPEYSFYTWMHKITVNEVYKHRKKEAQTSEVETSVEGGVLESIALADINPRKGLKGLEYEEFYRELWKQIQTLSENKQSVFILRVFQGLALKEIADVLDLTVDNVKVLLYRARKELAVKLKGFLRHEE